MIFIFLLQIVKINVANNIATITGDSSITTSIVQSSQYKLIEKCVIEYGPTEIGNSAFSGCGLLESISIPQSIISIGENPFTGCKRLNVFEVPNTHSYLRVDVQGGLYSYNQTILYRIPMNASDFNVPEGVEIIWSSSFEQNTKIRDIIFPKTVRRIKSQAFNSNGPLRTIKFATGSVLETIDKSAFWYQSATEIHLPPSLKTIGSQAFEVSLSSSIIFDDISESNLTTIGSNCFKSFGGRDIQLPSGLESLPNGCFISSTKLETINIPQKCTSISDTAFSLCPNLKNITVEKGNTVFSSINGSLYDVEVKKLYILSSDLKNYVIPSTLEEISKSAIQIKKKLTSIDTSNNNRFSSSNGLLYNSGRTEFIGICGGITEAVIESKTIKLLEYSFASTQVTKVEFDSNSLLESILSVAFLECKQLENIRFPNKVKSVGSNCFQDCTKLSQIEFDIDSPITSFGYRCFIGTNLSKFVFPRNIQQTGMDIFLSCKSLQHIIFQNEIDYKITSGAFKNCQNLRIIDGVSKITAIENNAFYECYSLDLNFSELTLLKSIGNSAFQLCAISEVRIGREITSIDNFAFMKNSNLKTAIFDEDTQVTAIKPSIFASCTTLSYVILPKGMKFVDPSAFGECTSLTEFFLEGCENYAVYKGLLYTKDLSQLVICPAGRLNVSISSQTSKILPDSIAECLVTKLEFEDGSKLESISKEDFRGCTKLTTVLLSESLQKIGVECFKDFPELSEVQFPNTLTSIGSDAFSNCGKLRSVSLEKCNSLSTIPERCFKGSPISEIELPRNLQRIGSESFSGCKLSNVRLYEKVASIDVNAFTWCTTLQYVMYCGVHDIGSKNAMPEGVIVYVGGSFRGDMFCERRVVFALDSKCEFLPRTATGSFVFTKSIQQKESLIMLSVCVMQETELNEGK